MFDILRYSELNKAAYKRLKAAVVAGNVVPFVGAGLSVPVFPTWSAALEKMAEPLAKKPQCKHEFDQIINDKINGNAFERAADFIVESLSEHIVMGQLLELFNEEKIEVSDKYKNLAAHILPKLFRGKPVVTTNYDRVLEHVYKDANDEFECVLGSDPSRIESTVQSSYHCLIKIHGDIGKTINPVDIIISGAKYAEAYSDNSSLTKTLSSLFKGKVMLFLGCSLESDRTLDVLKKICADSSISHFAIIDCEESKQVDRLKFLGSHNITPIFYDKNSMIGYGAVSVILNNLLFEIKEGTDDKASKKLMLSCLQDEQDKIKRDAIMPWLRNSPKIEALFPSLFIEPIYRSESLRVELHNTTDLLERYTCKNIILIGEAGVGKTTLLRQLFLFKNESNRILYLHSRALKSPSNELQPYQSFVMDLINGTQSSDCHYLVLIDGIDETFPTHDDELSELIKCVSKLKNVNVWFGWRREHFYLTKSEALLQLCSDIVSLTEWNEDNAKKYVERFAEGVNKREILTKYTQLLINNGNLALRSFIKNPFQLSLLVYLIDIQDSDSAISSFLDNKKQTIYGLYNVFFNTWVKKERTRGTSMLPETRTRSELHTISKKLYYGTSCIINSNDTAITDLLTFSDFRNVNEAGGFFHRSFCAFFLADYVYASVRAGDLSLVEALCLPLKNDVTDFLRSAISGNDKAVIRKIQSNLISVYRQIDSPKRRLLSDAAKSCIKELSIEDLLVIKNEIIYLLTRIPDPDSIIPSFIEDLYSKEMDPYLRLDLAYGATLTGPKHIALEYAKSMEPGSESERINRSWTLAYFGDVHKKPQEYIDDSMVPWTNAREVRLERFRKTDYKSMRFRLFDFPLMYCFYESREWKPVSENDYAIIQRAEVMSEYLSAEETEFLIEKKELLLSEYRKHLEI